jgi:hypothetical protein
VLPLETKWRAFSTDASDPNNVKYWKRKNKVEIRQRNQLSAKR